MTESEPNAQIAALGPWFHNLRLSGIETAPDHFLGDFPQNKFAQFAHLVPEDLTGKSVLDIGCNAGFYALEMKRRGARRVVAIDADPRYLRQAQLARDLSRAEISILQLSVYDVATLQERFDLVLFLGVFYHLRHPLLALDLIHEHVAKDQLLFQSLQAGDASGWRPEADYPFQDQSAFDARFPAFHLVERSFAGDPTNWFIPNRGGVEAALRSSGFAIEAMAGDVYRCARAVRPESVEPPPTIARL